jgi:hypothetical protein
MHSVYSRPLSVVDGVGIHGYIPAQMCVKGTDIMSDLRRYARMNIGIYRERYVCIGKTIYIPDPSVRPADTLHP